MIEQRIKIGRRGRPAIGFDMSVPGNKEVSHRQLIARAVTSVINKDYKKDRILAKFDEEEFAEALQKRIEQAGKFTPKQMVQFLTA